MNPKLVLYLSSAIALSSCAHPPPDEREILAIVLQHFSQRADTSASSEDGLVLVTPKTDAWKDEEFVELSSMDGEEQCHAQSSSYESFVARNKNERPADKLLREAERWRLATQAEMDEGFLITAREPGEVPVKTVVTLYAPGFSDNGREAFVFFAFSWSMHGARASYVLERAGEQWKIQCSQLNFFV